MVGASVKNEARLGLKGSVEVCSSVNPVENALGFYGVFADVSVDPVIVFAFRLAWHDGGKRAEVALMRSFDILINLGGLGGNPPPP